jgi:microsomal dipeptidase-like Zn-dependent dipeptidase
VRVAAETPGQGRVTTVGPRDVGLITPGIFWNPSFEAAGTIVPRSFDPLKGWSFANGQPLPTTARKTGEEVEVTSDQFQIGGKAPARLGGDYWKVPFPARRHWGQAGDWWLEIGGSQQFNSEGVTVLSPVFRINPEHKYLSFLLLPSPGSAGSIQLQLLDTQGKVLLEQRLSPPAQENQSKRFSVDLAKLPIASRTLPMRLGISVNYRARFDDFRLDASPLREVRAAGYTPIGLWGFADLHTHPMAHLGFGGQLIHGEPIGSLKNALRPCQHMGGTNPTITMNGFEPGHSHSGWPDFRDWPRFNTALHQQLHIEFIRRAWEGGLRLMVTHAVHNALLARYFGNDPKLRNDMKSAINQLEYLKQIVEQGKDFMEIAASPQDARRIISQGKLAIVPGVEIDSIGACHEVCPVKKEQDIKCDREGAGGDCTEAKVVPAINKLYDDYGVRHIFLVHHTDNDFGGTAIYENTFNLHNYFLRGDTYKVASLYNKSFKGGFNEKYGATAAKIVDEVRFGVDSAFDPFKMLFGNVNFPSHLDYPLKPHVNQKGLTPLGKFAVSKVLEKGMILEVDHMSALGRAWVYENAQKPVVAGHTGFQSLKLATWETDDHHAKLATENDKSDWEVQKIGQLGGVIGVGVTHGDVKKSPLSHVAQDCSGSSRAWLQGYIHAATLMGGRGVALATDNGLNMQTVPRFGTWACIAKKKSGNVFHEDDPRRGGSVSLRRALRDDADAQRSAVTYDQPLKSFHTKRFSRPGGGVCIGDFLTKGLQVECPETSEPYDYLERAAWQAIVIYKSGITDAQLRSEAWINANLSQAADWKHGIDRAQHFAIGFIQKEEKTSWGFGYVGWGEERAAWLVKNGRKPTDSEHADVHKFYKAVKRVWDKYHEMVNESGNKGAPLARSTLGNREFDYNIDGLAHYGLLPDMLQDASNLLKQSKPSPLTTVRDLRTLFRSAEDYVRMWEKVVAKGKMP